MSATPRPSPFSETLAHPGDPLPAHLQRVAERAAASIAPGARPEIRALAYHAGLFHDIGKATPWFQDYLLGRGRRSVLSHHAELGALLAWHYSGALDWPLWQRLALFIAVRRHHGALAFDHWSQLLARTRAAFAEPDCALRTQLGALDLAGIHGWLLERLQLTAPLSIPDPETIESGLRGRAVAGSRLRRALTTLDEALSLLAGFGALLALDKTDTALAGARRQRQVLPVDAVSRYKARHFEVAPAPDSLDARRAQIAETVTATWAAHPEAPLLTLTAPTGAGKTLSLLDAALRLRALIERRDAVAPRIIYCLPFTSVIDQNHAVLRGVLAESGLDAREDLLLKHHHLSESRYRDAENEYEADGAGALLVETWQSELVVTTFHQLLYTLLSPRNANLKRAGQLTGALILLDEVQALPLRYWAALRQLFMTAARVYGARIVLLTATRPLIFRPGDAVELLPDHEVHFRALARTRLHVHHREPLTLDAFGERLAAALADDRRATLVVLNRRRAVRALFVQLRERLPGRPLVALSTDLTPFDRRARIRLIQRLRARGEPVVVVATQLVEAGVDLSFPVVHRDLAPLDSIIQAAGRCNRHAEADGTGEVHLWQLCATRADATPGEPLWRRVYDAALIDVTQGCLGTRAYWDEAEFLSLSQDYFSGCWARQDQTRVDELLARGDLLGVEQGFRLIESAPALVALFVVRRPADARLWARYRALRDDPTLAPAEQKRAFRAFKRAFHERVIQVHVRDGEGIDRDEINRIEAGPATYDRAAGFVALPIEDSSCIF
ncbi:MAG: CRISPR-associated helicase Cas3' [Marichromatium sp.]|nr:CRISPR-associated helicase Cas3' [Marichromatium sp.]